MCQSDCVKDFGKPACKVLTALFYLLYHSFSRFLFSTAVSVCIHLLSFCVFYSNFLFTRCSNFNGSFHNGNFGKKCSVTMENLLWQLKACRETKGQPKDFRQQWTSDQTTCQSLLSRQQSSWQNKGERGRAVWCMLSRQMDYFKRTQICQTCCQQVIRFD